MQLSHTRPVAAACFDDPNLVSAAGLVPVMALAQRSGLQNLADEHLTVPGDTGSNAGRKIGSLVAGMVAGADSISDMAILRHGAMHVLFERPYAPSTLGSFLRQFRFGHNRQLDAVASRLLQALAERTPLLAGIDTDLVMIDIDDSIIEVHGHDKQGSGYGYSGIRGLNSLITTVTTETAAPVITAQRLCKGACGSSRGAARMIADTLTTVDRLRQVVIDTGTGTHVAVSQPKPLLRADSAYFGHPSIGAAIRGGADVSITTGLNSVIKTAISAISDDAWTTIRYTNALYDTDTERWISAAEIPFTAFASQKKSHHVPGRLVVRRIPDLRPKRDQGQGELFDVWRFDAFFTTTDPADLDTVTADQIHRCHAIIEQVHADLKNSALAHMPSGKFCANAAWLVCAVMAFNLARAAAHLDQQSETRESNHRNHPANIDLGARTHRLVRPQTHPAPAATMALGNELEGIVRQHVRAKRPHPGLTGQSLPAHKTKGPVEQPDTRGRALNHAQTPAKPAQYNSPSCPQPIGAFRLM